jgi:hypothetical protein
MSGDDYRQAQRIEAMREYSEQSLLAQAYSQVVRRRLTPTSILSESIDHGRRPAHPANSPVSRKNIGQYCTPRLLSRAHST